MGVTPTILVDSVSVQVAWTEPSGASFVALISMDLDPDARLFPSANNSTDCEPWTSPTNAHSTNDKYASCAGSTPKICSTMYSGFGFNIPVGSTITLVRVWLVHSENTVGDFVEVDIGTPGSPDTCGNMVNYSPTVQAVFPNRPSLGLDTVDITSQRSWVPGDFNSNNLRALMLGFRGIL